MTKELIFKKSTPMGEIKIVLRIIRSILYFKFSNSNEANQMISFLSQKGARFRKSANWLEVDLFGDLSEVKLGDFLFNLEEDNSEEIEDKLAKFYTIQYIKSGFALE